MIGCSDDGDANGADGVGGVGGVGGDANGADGDADDIVGGDSDDFIFLVISCPVLITFRNSFFVFS